MFFSAMYKSTFQRNWFEMNASTLIHPLRLPLDNLPAECTRCQVSVAVWSPTKTSPELKDLEILEAFLRYNPEDVLKQHGKIVRQIGEWKHDNLVISYYS